LAIYNLYFGSRGIGVCGGADRKEDSKLKAYPIQKITLFLSVVAENEEDSKKP